MKLIAWLLLTPLIVLIGAILFAPMSIAIDPNNAARDSWILSFLFVGTAWWGLYFLL